MPSSQRTCTSQQSSSPEYSCRKDEKIKDNKDLWCDDCQKVEATERYLDMLEILMYV